MRLVKILLIVFVLSAFAAPAFADDLFYQLNSDLKRSGMDELRKLASAGFEAENYRLDPDFVLGCGDTVRVDFWGKIEGSYRLTVDRDGIIVVPMLGKINVMGMTIEEARSAVKREIDKKFSNVEFSLNFVEAKDIRISILGEVQNPGMYSISPFCRIAEAVVKSGGLTNTGSLADIKLIRNEKEIVSFSVYDFLFKADQSKNARLKHGDVIFIPKAKGLVAIRGDVKNSGIYEASDGNLLSLFISTAGGISGSVKSDMKIYVLRLNPMAKTMEIFKEIIVEPSKGIGLKDDFPLENYDTVIVTNVFDYTAIPVDIFKKVTIEGEVKSPGSYLIRGEDTLSSLINRAGGMKNTAFAEGIVFTRNSLKERQKSMLEQLVRQQEKSVLDEEIFLANAVLTQEEKALRRDAIERKRKALDIMASRRPKGRIIIDDLEDVMSGKSDIILEKDDSVYIPSIPNWVLVTGAVYNPESVIFVKEKPMEYYLNEVGGPTRSADKDDIYVIKASGCVKSKATGYGVISHGDIIVVPEKIQ